MKRLLIVSDIDGLIENTWINSYCEAFRTDFDITLADSLLIAGLDADISSPEEIHEKMIKEGIKAASETIQNDYLPFDALIGFSVGGTILWKSMLNRNSSSKLACVSSTRLRFEVSTPTCSLLTLYGDQDKFRPPADWFNEKTLKRRILSGNHDFYKSETGIPATITELKRFLLV